MTDPWKNSKLRAALHGLLYGLPAVCFPAAAGLLSGLHVLRALIVALLTSWALSQALAYLGYARLGRAGSAAAARLLLVGMTVTVAGVTLALAMAGLVAHARVTGLIFGFGLGAYMLGATVLLVLGAEGLLLVVLAPGVLGSAAFLLLGRPTLSTRPGRPWRPRRCSRSVWPPRGRGERPASVVRVVSGSGLTGAANAAWASCSAGGAGCPRSLARPPAG